MSAFLVHDAVQVYDLFCAVHLVSANNIQFGSQLFTIPQSAASGSGTPVRTALLELFYVHGYCHRIGTTATAQDKVPRDLSSLLSEANASRSVQEDGWLVDEVEPNGTIWATRCGRVQRFAVGQYSVSDGRIPLVHGSQVVIVQPRETRAHQGAQYFAYGEATGSIADEARLLRLYWHISEDGLGPLFKLLTARLNRFGVPFRLKAASISTQFPRRDAAVLYFARRYFGLAKKIALDCQQEVFRYLTDDVPLFTMRIAAGLGLAEDPGNGESFGQARCGLIADAVLDVVVNQQLEPKQAMEALERRFSAQHLKCSNPHINSFSSDSYDRGC